MIDALARDVRHGVRSMWRHRFVTALTVLTLSLGIGVVTALFAVIQSVLLEPIVPNQERVVRVSKLDTTRGNFPTSLSLPEFDAWRETTRSFEVLAAVDHAATGNIGVAVNGRVSAVRMSPVAGDFFRIVHRGQPLRGRWLLPSDAFVGAEPVAVISEGFWRRASGGDPAFVGRRLTWGANRTCVVVGVAPAAVDYPLGTDIWMPAAAVFDGQAGHFDARNPTFTQFELLGRLAPGVSPEQARAELAIINARVGRQFLAADDSPNQVVVEPVLDAVVGNSRRVVLTLFAAALLVFAIAGANVAALLLMRAADRRSEISVRAALGANLWRLLQQTLAESFVLGAAGALVGLVVARACLGAVLWLAPREVPRIAQASLSLGAFAFCGVAAAVWTLTLGLVPMWSHRHALLAPDAARSSRGDIRRTRGLTVFTVAQISLAVIVAIGAGLLLRSLGQLRTIDPGFESHDLVMMSLLLPDDLRKDPRAMLAFYDRLLPRIDALPGVASASPTHVGPGSGTLGLSAPMRFEGQTVDAAKTNPWSTWEPILPSYFRTLGIRLVSGRSFTEADARDRAPVAIVSEAVADRYWPGQSPIGKRLQFVATAEWPWVTVVGVAADTRYRDLINPWMTVYFPADQFFFFQAGSLLVRTTLAPKALVPAVLQQLEAIEPGATIESSSRMDALLTRELARPWTAMTVSAGFALLAVLLAAVGVYGVLTYEVRQRKREIAVRLTLGAAPGNIFRTVVRRSVSVAASGVAIGVTIAALTTHALQPLLYGVPALDSIAFLAGAMGLLAVALLASYLPARSAAGIEPAAALRSE